MKFYGAYGSNLNLKQMSSRCPNSLPFTTVVIKKWRMSFKGVADIVADINCIVPVGIYKITDKCENELNKHEEYPSVYKKVYIECNILGKIEEVLFYKMNNSFKDGPPSIKYFNTIKKGYDDWSLDYKSLKSSLEYSLNNNSYKYYTSKNWIDSKIISKTDQAYLTFINNSNSPEEV